MVRRILQSTVMKIIDFRDECKDDNLRHAVEYSLLSQKPRIPSLLLWNERGIDLFTKIATDEPANTYHSGTEAQIFGDFSEDIQMCIGNGGILIDLGAGLEAY